MNDREEHLLPLPLGGGGCITKLPFDLLASVLGDEALVGRWKDTGMVPVPAGEELHLSVDMLTPIVSDPSIFGRIVTHHCLADLYAAGAKPLAAVAIVAVPGSSEAAGAARAVLDAARSALATEGVRLVGGHSVESRDFLFGLAVMGVGGGELRRPILTGDQIVLTKPLGSGIIISATAEPGSPSPGTEGVREAIETMCSSNAAASASLLSLGAKVMTDVTGFGLVGNLVNILQVAGAVATLWIDTIPVIPAARQLAATGYPFCSFNRNRASFASHLTGSVPADICALLFDAQTSGGLLAVLPGDADAGSVPGVHVIGEVTALGQARAEVKAAP